MKKNVNLLWQICDFLSYFVEVSCVWLFECEAEIAMPGIIIEKQSSSSHII